MNAARGGLCQRDVLNQGISNEAEWWKALGGKGPVGPSVAAQPKVPAGINRLMMVSYDPQTAVAEIREVSISVAQRSPGEVACGPAINKSQLDNQAIFIFGTCGIA